MKKLLATALIATVGLTGMASADTINNNISWYKTAHALENVAENKFARHKSFSVYKNVQGKGMNKIQDKVTVRSKKLGGARMTWLREVSSYRIGNTEYAGGGYKFKIVHGHLDRFERFVDNIAAQSYRRGFDDGFTAGYDQGYKDGAAGIKR